MAGLVGDGVLTTRVAYTPLYHAQTGKGCQEVLTGVQVGRGSRAEGATGRPAAMMVRSAGWWRCRACSGLIPDQVA